MKNSFLINAILLVSLVSIPLGAGWLGSLVTMPNIEGWYAGLVKPPLTPLSAVFGPVWTALYILMSVASFLVIKIGWQRKDVRSATLWYGWQLLLNMLWSLVFFGLQSPLLGLVVITALWASILMTIRKFFRLSKTAAILLLPYVLWVTFAAYLNYGIYARN